MPRMNLAVAFLHYYTKSSGLTLDNLKYLHGKGADLSAKNDYGYTPLDYYTINSKSTLDGIKYFSDQGMTSA